MYGVPSMHGHPGEHTMGGHAMGEHTMGKHTMGEHTLDEPYAGRCHMMGGSQDG